MNIKTKFLIRKNMKNYNQEQVKKDSFVLSTIKLQQQIRDSIRLKKCFIEGSKNLRLEQRWNENIKRLNEYNSNC